MTLESTITYLEGQLQTLESTPDPDLPTFRSDFYAANPNLIPFTTIAGYNHETIEREALQAILTVILQKLHFQLWLAARLA